MYQFAILPEPDAAKYQISLRVIVRSYIWEKSTSKHGYTDYGQQKFSVDTADQLLTAAHDLYVRDCLARPYPILTPSRVTQCSQYCIYQRPCCFGTR